MPRALILDFGEVLVRPQPASIVAEMAAECGLALPQAGLTREICGALKPQRYKLERYGR